MIKRLAFTLICLGTLSVAVFGQTSGSSRPRVVPTPTPAAVYDAEDPQRTGRQAPVLKGGDKKRSEIPAVTEPVTDEENEVVKVETNLVTMPVSVLDRDGRFVSGLSQKDFGIFENGVEQKVDYFQSVEKPFTVVLMIDVSPSTAYQIDQIHNSAIAFVNQLRPNDRVMVIAFDDNVRVLSQPTSNRSQLRNAIRMAQFGDGTSLYEAVDYAINRALSGIEGRKALVIFTDGVDTTSRRSSYQSTVQDAEETDVLIYPVRYNTQRDGFGGGYGGGNRRGGGGGWGNIIGIILGGAIPNAQGGGVSANAYELGRKYMETLAQNSGGRKFEADTLMNMDAAFAGIAEELRRQYSLGYYPETVGQKGERKQIKVRVMRPNLIVRAKTSYIVGETDRRFAGN
ncbi:MAG: VWA domain-containing protein [Blastocatellia bacterium]